MTFNIRNFIGNINRYGTLQTNRFKVMISPPRLLTRSTGMMERLSYRAESARVPGLAIDATEVRRTGVGPREKVAVNVGFSDMGITFIEEGNNDVFKFFYTWVNGIFDFTGSRGGSNPTYSTAYKRDYVSEKIEIYVYDNSGKLVNKVVLKEAFPISLSETNLSWSDNNQLYKLNVTFAYTSWYLDGYSSTPGFESPVPSTPQAPQVSTPAQLIPEFTREDLPPLPGASASDSGYNPTNLRSQWLLQSWRQNRVNTPTE